MDARHTSYFSARALATALSNFRETMASLPASDSVGGIDAELAIAELALRRFALEVGLESGLIRLKPLPAQLPDESGD